MIRRGGLRFDRAVFGWTCCVFLAATAVCVARQTRVYEAVGVLQILRPQVMTVNAEVLDASIRSSVDMNTIRAVMDSATMMRWVSDRMSAEERADFFKPYGLSDQSFEAFDHIVRSNRRLNMEPRSLILKMRYRHPDRRVASRVVEMFLNEGVAYEARVRGDETRAAIEQLEQRANAQKKLADESKRTLEEYRNRQSGLNEEQLKLDTGYQDLEKKTALNKQVHEMILKRLAEASGGRDDAAHIGWKVIDAPVAPAEDGYLIAPLVVTATWGAGFSMIAGGFCALIFRRKSQSSIQSEGLS